VDRACGGFIGGLPPLRAKIALARESDWKRYPSLYLADIADDPSKVQVLFDALGDVLAAH
jgi:hypothetical protein